jgi:acetyltransferase-like isoleucine patch superfamily enzyme
MNLLERILFVMPKGLKSRLKIILYRMLGMQLGKRNRFEGGKCRCLPQIEIGNDNVFYGGGYMLWPLPGSESDVKIRIKNNNFFNRNIYIDACGYIEIGNGCMFGPDVYITDSNHQSRIGSSSRELPMNIGRVVIGDNCWIGAKAVILKDVELGDHCIVGAGAVVTKSFPAGSIIVGVPGRLAK